MSKKVKKLPEIFGSMVFDEVTMKERLSATTYKAWKKCVTDGAPSSLTQRTILESSRSPIGESTVPLPVISPCTSAK